MSESILKTKSFDFAVRIVRLSRSLMQENHEYVLSKQILRSGTSIGANIEEADQARSRKDFIHKPAIALKEATETNYWLRLLRESGSLEAAIADSFLDDCRQIERMLTASIKTTKSATT